MQLHHGHYNKLLYLWSEWWWQFLQAWACTVWSSSLQHPDQLEKGSTHHSTYRHCLFHLPIKILMFFLPKRLWNKLEMVSPMIALSSLLRTFTVFVSHVHGSGHFYLRMTQHHTAYRFCFHAVHCHVEEKSVNSISKTFFVTSQRPRDE